MTASSNRLLVVSNRLPVTIKANPPGSDKPWSYSMSSGGLVSGLSGLKQQKSFTWIGFQVDAESEEELAKELLEQYSCYPVFLSNEVADLHYNGFSNSTLWPLFHYLPGEINFDEAQWDGYYRANVAFAAAIKELVKDGDMIWVHDYHLLLMPALLREMLVDLPNVKIGFFLHTPFPSSEVYKVLPVRKQILLGVLQCDLIGFHTYDYARHFLSSCARILGISTMPNGLEFDGRFVHVGTFPIGIDPVKFIDGVKAPAVEEALQELAVRFAGKKVMVGVDRLDYIKGVPHKLHAFDQLLSRYPEFQGKVALIQVAVPTRTEVEEYKNLRTSVNELVGRINGKFGTFNFTPVQYLYRSISFEQLCALYRIADVCVVTSTRDGMNLVSYEFIASQEGKHGRLILSEFAGAAQSMNGSIIVNPWNIDELVEAYREALTTPPEKAAADHQKLFKYVMKHTASYWGNSFVEELSNIASDSGNQKQYVKLTKNLLKEGIMASKEQKLFFIDFDGLSSPLNAGMEHLRVNPRLVEAINRIAAMPNALVYVASGSTRNQLETVFANSNVGLVCEYGCFIRHPPRLSNDNIINPSSTASSPTPSHADCWISLSNTGDDSWRDLIRPVLKFYTDHTPGSVTEEKERSFVWHFRESDPEFGGWQASELQANLEKLLSHNAVSVTLSPKMLEIRPSGVSRTAALKRIIADMNKICLNSDFVFCVGDARFEDALFTTADNYISAVNNQLVFTTTVSKRRSTARYYVDTVNDVILLLSNIA